MSIEKTKQYDLTQGDILQKLFVIALPVIGMQLMQMIYNMADMFWMGKMGTDALAATSTSGMYLWLSMGFMVLGRMGAEIGVSQSMGSGDRDSAERYMTNSFLISAVIGILIGAGMTFGRTPLVQFFAIKEPAVIELAEIYLGISGIGLPMMFVSTVIAGAFTGAGNSQLVFYITTIGIVFNLILDPIMIFGMNMGITGAAVSNVLGQLLGLALSLWALYRHPTSLFKKAALIAQPHMDTMKRIFKWGLPIATEALLFPFLSILTTRMVAAWGSKAIAAQRIGSQAESLTWLVAGGFCMAVTSFIGQNYGAVKWDRIQKGLRISAGMLTIYGIAVTAFLYFGGSPIYRVFTSDNEVISLGIRYLQIFAICQLATCLESLFAGWFRGIGRTTPPSVISITGNIIRVVAAAVLSRTSLGLDGIYWAVSLGAILRSAILIVWFFIQSRKLPKESTAPASLSAEEM
jgi:putative efflux protein, MATE family